MIGRALMWAACVVAVMAVAVSGCATTQYRIDIKLSHCGVSPVTVAGRTWEMPEPQPLTSASTLPPDYTGHGVATVESGNRLRYVDDGGFRMEFHPAEDVPDPPPCS